MVLVKVLKGLLLSLYTKLRNKKVIIKEKLFLFGKFVICIDNNKERGEIEDGFGKKIFINIRRENRSNISPLDTVGYGQQHD